MSKFDVRFFINKDATDARRHCNYCGEKIKIGEERAIFIIKCPNSENPIKFHRNCLIKELEFLLNKLSSR